MKKNILFCFLSVFVVSDMLAQFQQRLPSGPVHPLINYGHIRMDTDIDTIFWKTDYEMGIETVNTGLPSGGIHFYNRSKDNLTDTLTILFGLIRCEVFRYNDKNQLLYLQEVHPNGETLPAYLREEFGYDKEGRLIEHVTKWITTSDTPSEKTLSLSIYDYSTVRMTESGYTFGFKTHDFVRDEIAVYDITYELDEQGRVTQEIYNDKNEYIEFIDGEKYRTGTVYYSYTDNSYSKFSCHPSNNTVAWHETTYVFDEHGNLIFMTTKLSFDGINWSIWEQSEALYVYSNSNEIITTNATFETTSRKVYGANGSVVIQSDQAEAVRIYSISGLFIREINMSPGCLSIPLSKGFYIVMMNNSVYKVMVI